MEKVVRQLYVVNERNVYTQYLVVVLLTSQNLNDTMEEVQENISGNNNERFMEVEWDVSGDKEGRKDRRI